MTRSPKSPTTSSGRGVLFGSFARASLKRTRAKAVRLSATTGTPSPVSTETDTKRSTPPTREQVDKARKAHNLWSGSETGMIYRTEYSMGGSPHERQKTLRARLQGAFVEGYIMGLAEGGKP